MKHIHWLVVGLALFALTARADEKERKFTFTKSECGGLPAGWIAAKTGEGDGSVWKVMEDRTAPSKTGFVLAQTARGPRRLFNLCVVKDSSYKDVEIDVAFKANRGKIDQGGGVVWRYQDANNYYIARMNPLERNYRVYKVVEGKRKRLATQENLNVPAGQWHTIKIKHCGDHIRCYLDGKKYLDVRDSTFTEAGRVGLWTKADAQTSFDEFEVEEEEDED